MRTISAHASKGKRRLIEALAEWGLHEWTGRLKRPAHSDAHSLEAFLDGANTGVWYRAPLVVRILVAEPQERTLRVEIPWEEAATLHIADGRRLIAWTDAILVAQTEDAEHVRRLVAKNDPVVSSLICTARIAGQALLPPVVIFDGWHRAAAWVEHGRRGNKYSITADIILTNEIPPLLGELQP